MTTKQPKERIRLPDPPEIPRMTSFDRLHRTGNTHNLAEHFGNEKTTIVGGERHISAAPTSAPSGRIIPDLLIAFGVDSRAYEDSRGYIITEQGKPPDFVLEIASPSTGKNDVTTKRMDYAELGVAEYWRFDQTGGDWHGEALAGDRLADGSYEPITVETTEDGARQGYSAVLDLILRWEQGQLLWIDSDTGRHITRLSDERERADNAEARADNADARANAEQADRIQADARADTAEARVRELEEKLRRNRDP